MMVDTAEGGGNSLGRQANGRPRRLSPEPVWAHRRCGGMVGRAAEGMWANVVWFQALFASGSVSIGGE